MIEVRIRATPENFNIVAGALQWFAAPPQTAFLEGEAEHENLVLYYDRFSLRDAPLMYIFWQRLRLSNFSVGHERLRLKAT